MMRKTVSRQTALNMIILILAAICILSIWPVRIWTTTTSSSAGGTIVGEHSVIFAGTDEVLEFKHEAFSKKIFSKGAVKAAEYILGKEPKIYTMEDILF